MQEPRNSRLASEQDSFSTREVFLRAAAQISIQPNNIATGINSQNNANHKIKSRNTHTHTIAGNTKGKGVFQHASTKWRPRGNPVWLNATNGEKPEQSCSTRGATKHYYCSASRSILVQDAGQHRSSPEADHLSRPASASLRKNQSDSQANKTPNFPVPV